MNIMSRPAIIKAFFGTPEKPVSSSELLDFGKNDREGYIELSDLAAVALGVTVKEAGTK